MAMRAIRRILGAVLLLSLFGFIGYLLSNTQKISDFPYPSADDESWLNMLFGLAAMIMYFGAILIGGVNLLRSGLPNRGGSILGLIGFALFWWIVMGRVPVPVPIVSVETFIGFMLFFGTTLCFIFDLLLLPWRRPTKV
jgi:hypothetical protein